MIKLLLKAFRAVLPLVATFGVHEVLDNAIKTTTPSKISKYRSWLTKIGGWILAGFITDKVAEYVEPKIEEMTAKGKDAIKSGKEMLENRKTEKTEEEA